VQRRNAPITVVFVFTILAAAYSPEMADATTALRAYPAQARGAAPTAAADACSLLKKEAAAAALGGTVSGPKSSGPRAGGPGITASSCEYSGSGVQVVHLNLMQLPAEQAAIYKGLCAQKGHEGLTGLGEVACWYNDKHEELQVLKGTTFFSIELRGKPNPTEPIKAVAKKVFDQLR
jgi:hypothetical protein